MLRLSKSSRSKYDMSFLSFVVICILLIKLTNSFTFADTPRVGVIGESCVISEETRSADESHAGFAILKNIFSSKNNSVKKAIKSKITVLLTVVTMFLTLISLCGSLQLYYSKLIMPCRFFIIKYIHDLDGMKSKNLHNR